LAGNSPSPVNGLQVKNASDGHTVYLDWSPNPAAENMEENPGGSDLLGGHPVHNGIQPDKKFHPVREPPARANRRAAGPSSGAAERVTKPVSIRHGADGRGAREDLS